MITITSPSWEELGILWDCSITCLSGVRRQASGVRRRRQASGVRRQASASGVRCPWGQVILHSYLQNRRTCIEYSGRGEGFCTPNFAGWLPVGCTPNFEHLLAHPGRIPVVHVHYLGHQEDRRSAHMLRRTLPGVHYQGACKTLGEKFAATQPAAPLALITPAVIH
jgi:hypothetical protein